VQWGFSLGTSCSFVPPLKTDDFAVPSDFKESKQGAMKAAKDADQDLINGLNPLRAPVKGMDQTGFDKTRSKSNPLSTGPWWKELGDPVLDSIGRSIVEVQCFCAPVSGSSEGCTGKFETS
jgi:hypothetical protein